MALNGHPGDGKRQGGGSCHAEATTSTVVGEGVSASPRM